MNKNKAYSINRNYVKSCNSIVDFAYQRSIKLDKILQARQLQNENLLRNKRSVNYKDTLPDSEILSNDHAQFQEEHLWQPH